MLPRDSDMVLDWTAARLASTADVAPSSSAIAPSKIVPFPVARRRGFITKLAAQMVARPADAAETHLSQQLRRQAQVLQRKGIPDLLIWRELHALEAAVRTELWRRVLGAPPPGGNP
jgi:type II secretory pathway predicted ATPase ExeA